MAPDDRRARLLAIVLAFSFAYFAQGGGANAYSRWDLTRALVDRHTLTIDHYAHDTQDKAEVNGHFYSDKAPGLALAATPAYFTVRLLHGFSPPTRASAFGALWAVTVAVIGLACALAGAALYRLLRRLGVGALASAGAVVAWTLGSNAYAYETSFMGHAFVGALLVLAFERLSRTPASRLDIALAGLFAGWAAISEFPAAVLAAMLLAYAVVRHRVRSTVPFAIAGAVPLVVLGAYNAACFGSPFSLGYQHLAKPEFQRVIAQGFFGMSLPSPRVLVELAFGEFRGLLPLAPWVAIALVGLVLLARKKALRAEAAVAIAAPAVLFLLCGSYARWDGGTSMGPRYFVPALGFLAIGLAFAIDAIDRLPRGLAILAWTVSAAAIAIAILTCTACVAVFPEFPDVAGAIPPPVPDMPPVDAFHPITTLVIPLLLRGHVSEKASFPDGTIGWASAVPGHDGDSWNLGEVLGLHGVASLLPLFLVWAAALAWELHVTRRSARV
jgi:hypothetical protein